MKILITADPFIPVPPKLYGGIERIIDGLIIEYSKLGHDVYLIAHPQSTSDKSKEIIGWKTGYDDVKLSIPKNGLQLLKAVKRIKPDVIHSFSRLLFLYPTILLSKTKIIMSFQREISWKSTMAAKIISGRKLFFTSCGEHMLKNIRFFRDSFTSIHNFTDTDFYTDAPVEKTHFFFLGRIEDIKGVYEAIESIRDTPYKLIIAGNIEKDHNEYYSSKVEPFLVDGKIEYIGPINDQQKRDYFQRSIGFLFPIKWEEPFGIVMAESLACGTPVIGFNRGSVPEVIKNGVNGYIVDGVCTMTEKLNDAFKLDRHQIQKDAINRFSINHIANEYLALYNQRI